MAEATGPRYLRHGKGFLLLIRARVSGGMELAETRWYAIRREKHFESFPVTVLFRQQHTRSCTQIMRRNEDLLAATDKKNPPKYLIILMAIGAPL